MLPADVSRAEPAYLPGDMSRRLASAVLVYGTVREAGTNRYAAEREQTAFREGAQREVPILRDFEATDALLAHKDVIFIGRPEANSALAAWREKLGLDYKADAFRVEGKIYSSERNALVFAAKNPLDASHMVLVYAGNSPLETVQSRWGREGKRRGWCWREACRSDRRPWQTARGRGTGERGTKIRQGEGVLWLRWPGIHRTSFTPKRCRSLRRWLRCLN